MPVKITKKTHHDLLKFHCLITTNHHIMILTRSSSINQFLLSLTINHHHIMFHMPDNGELKQPPVESYQITIFDHVCWSHITTIWLFNIAMERSTIFKNGKPSISMGHLYHGYVTNNQRVNPCQVVGACIMIIAYPYITIFCHWKIPMSWISQSKPSKPYC
jgi:hypothetical protein